MLQYSAEVQDVTQNTGVQCPPSTATEDERTAWRWVFSPMTPRCFAPQAVRNPARLTRAKDAAEMCSCWGLSMHVTEKDSIDAFHNVEASFPKARKMLGTHVATCKIGKAHGLSTPHDKYGHFDLHPYASAPFLTTFVLKKAIP